MTRNGNTKFAGSTVNRKSSVTAACIVVLLVAIGLRVRWVSYPVPVPSISWRECDIAGIAQNFSNEGMNILYPRIDWRGDGPGYTEMEFPLFPWLIACSYKIAGRHEEAARAISLMFGCCSLGLFVCLAGKLLPALEATIAVLFFALNPLAVQISYSLQPEGLMLTCYLGSIFFFLCWLDNGGRRNYLLGLLFAALGMLAKITMAHVGLVFALLVYRKKGLRGLVDPHVIFFGLLSIVPSVLWYAHAHNLWLAYGNSLGVSNERHWFGPDLFADADVFKSLLNLQIENVWTVPGLIALILGMPWISRQRVTGVCVCWLAALCFYYLLTIRTTGAAWAYYYHIVSVPSASLLMGAVAGQLALWRLRRNRAVLWVTVSIIASAAFCLVLATRNELTVVRVGLFFAACVAFSLVVFCVWSYSLRVAFQGGAQRAITPMVGILGLLLCASAVLHARRSWMSPGNFWAHACVETLRSKISEPGLIVASGLHCVDQGGYPIAYNASYMFYLLNRKGFSVCEEEQSIQRIRSYADRGAKYFVAEKLAVAKKPGFREALIQAFPMVAECNEAYLFQIFPRAQGR